MIFMTRALHQSPARLKGLKPLSTNAFMAAMRAIRHISEINARHKETNKQHHQKHMSDFFSFHGYTGNPSQSSSGVVDSTTCMPASSNILRAFSACGVKSARKPPLPSWTATELMQSFRM